MTKNELVVIVHLGVHECAAHGFVAVCQTSKAKMKFRCVKCQPDVQFIALKTIATICMDSSALFSWPTHHRSTVHQVAGGWLIAGAFRLIENDVSMQIDIFDFKNALLKSYWESSTHTIHPMLQIP